MKEVYSFSMWKEPEPQCNLSITSGKFISSITDLLAPIIRASVTIGGKTYETDRALIDTGATQTVVFSSFIDSVNADPVGNTRMTSSSGTSDNVQIYNADITLPASITIKDIPICHSSASSPYIDMLIGLDVLSCGVFIYDGVNRRFLFETK